MKRIAIQGIRGAFHEIAARHYHQQPIDVVPAISFNELIVESKRNDGGIMAIENSIAGTLIRNFPLIQQSDLDITGEIYLRIKHNLMALPGQRIEDINKVYSHPMAIAQCRTFFEQFPHICLVNAEDTALSALKIYKEGTNSVAAIASTKAAELYQLEIIAESIETDKQNYTRFLSLERKSEDINEADFEKVSLCFTLKHEIGSLHKFLKLLSEDGANLTKIQSVPIIGDRWNYRFFIDFVMNDPSLYQLIIKKINKATTDLQVLGRYKTGIYYEN